MGESNKSIQILIQIDKKITFLFNINFIPVMCICVNACSVHTSAFSERMYACSI